MIVVLRRNSELTFEPILSEIGLDADGVMLYASNVNYAVRAGLEYICYYMQPTFEESEAALSEGGFIFASEDQYRKWLNGK